MLKTLVLAGMLLVGGAQAQTPPLRIGVLADLSGLYADIGGPGAVEAVRMAVEDFGGSVLGRTVEVLSGDTQNKPDVASSIARQWYDRDGVAMIVDLPSSPIALAVQSLAREKNRVSIVTGAGSDTLTGSACSPSGVHWVYDTYSTGKATADAVLRRGGDSWFLIQLDQAFGEALSKVLTAELHAKGAQIVGVAKHPLSMPDFSSLILEARTSGAKIIGLANAGGDTVNALKQAQEFGVIAGGQQVVALLAFISDVRSVGLKDAQGLVLTEAYYWDMNELSRGFAHRYFKRTKRMPTAEQAGDYSATLHYLNALKAAGTDEAGAVMAKMREMPVHDAFTQTGRLREDGRMVHDVYLVQVKSPKDSTEPWDVYNILETIRGEDAFRPLSESDCPLLKR